MKRFIAVMALAAGLGIAIASPAGAIIIIGGSEVALGGPDTRVSADAGMQPCITSVGGMLPCVAEGGLIIYIRLATEPVRS